MLNTSLVSKKILNTHTLHYTHQVSKATSLFLR